jgi:uncharacterized phosphosugar-binding protein
MQMLAKKYLDHASELMQRFQDTQLDNIEKAAEMIAQAYADGHTFYAWGGPHSSLPVQDIFERAGGLPLVNAVIAPGLSYEIGPIRVGMFLERLEGYGRFFLGEIGAEPGDVILLVSTSGRNPFPIEMAMSAKKAGLKVIGMTSMAYTTAVASRHSSGAKMFEYCDVVLDNLTEPGDASIADEQLPQKAGPTSGWMGCLILQTLMVAVCEHLAKKGITPPVYVAGNIDAEEEYKQSLLELLDKYGTRFGGIYSPRRKV